MTLNAGMIIVFCMFNPDITREHCKNDPQTIYTEITDNLITKHVNRKPYA
jgi:hypothetical protein